MVFRCVLGVYLLLSLCFGGILGVLNVVEDVFSYIVSGLSVWGVLSILWDVFVCYGCVWGYIEV